MMTNQEMSVYSNVLKIYCDLCMSTFGKRRNADGYCVNCSHNLCTDCCKYHKALPVTKTHVVIQDRDGFGKSERFVKKSVKCDDICSLHQGNVVKYHCSSCDQFCCSRCISETHSGCSKVSSMSDVTDDNKVGNVVGTLQNVFVDLERSKIKLTENEQKIKKLKEKAKAEFKEHAEKFIQSFDKIQSDFIKRIERLESDSQQKLKSVSRLHATLTSEVESLSSNITDCRKNGNRCELFKAVGKAETDLPTIRNSLKALERDNDIESHYRNGSVQVDQILSQIKALVQTIQGACIRIQHS